MGGQIAENNFGQADGQHIGHRTFFPRERTVNGSHGRPTKKKAALVFFDCRPHCTDNYPSPSCYGVGCINVQNDIKISTWLNFDTTLVGHPPFP